MKWRTTERGNCWSTPPPDGYFIAYRRRPGRAFGIFESFAIPPRLEFKTTTLGQDATLQEAKERCEKHHDQDLPAEFVRPMSHGTFEDWDDEEAVTLSDEALEILSSIIVEQEDKGS